MLALNDSRLVEVIPMMALPNDLTVDYSPRSLTIYLRRYHEIVALCDEVHTAQYEIDHHFSETLRRDEFEYVRIKRDIDSALLWLHQVDADPYAANLIYDHYVDGKLLADLADMEHVSQRTIGRTIARGIDAMAERLGWVRPAINR